MYQDMIETVRDKNGKGMGIGPTAVCMYQGMIETVRDTDRRRGRQTDEADENGMQTKRQTTAIYY